MKITRLFSDEHNHSVFEDFEIELRNAGEIGNLSKRYLVKEMIFRETGGDYDYDFHNAPERQFVILLDGEIEIETSSGERRRFSAGEILLVEDTTGNGHKSRSIDGQLRRSLFITLENYDII
jgi:hypothetical protein